MGSRKCIAWLGLCAALALSARNASADAAVARRALEQTIANESASLEEIKAAVAAWEVEVRKDEETRARAKLLAAVRADDPNVADVRKALGEVEAASKQVAALPAVSAAPAAVAATPSPPAPVTTGGGAATGGTAQGGATPAPSDKKTGSTGDGDDKAKEKKVEIKEPGIDTTNAFFTLGAVSLAPFSIKTRKGMTGEDPLKDRFYLDDSSNLDTNAFLEFRYRHRNLWDTLRELNDVETGVLRDSNGRGGFRCRHRRWLEVPGRVTEAERESKGFVPAAQTSDPNQTPEQKAAAALEERRRVSAADEKVVSETKDEFASDTWDDECLKLTDFDARLGFVFGGGNDVSGAAIVGSGDFYVSLSAGIPMFERLWVSPGENPRPIGLSIGPEFIGDLTTDRRVEDVHGRIGLGGAINLGAMITPLKVPGITYAPEPSARLAELTFRASYTWLDQPHLLGDIAIDKPIGDPSGKQRAEVASDHGFPEFRTESGNYGIDADLLVPFGNQGYLTVGASVFGGKVDPNPWSLRIGATVPLDAFAGIFITPVAKTASQ